MGYRSAVRKEGICTTGLQASGYRLQEILCAWHLTLRSHREKDCRYVFRYGDESQDSDACSLFSFLARQEVLGLSVEAGAKVLEGDAV